MIYQKHLILKPREIKVVKIPKNAKFQCGKNESLGLIVFEEKKKTIKVINTDVFSHHVLLLFSGGLDRYLIKV